MKVDVSGLNLTIVSSGAGLPAGQQDDLEKDK
jgi:hypothetical protein